MAQGAKWTDVDAPDFEQAEAGFDVMGAIWRRKWIVLCILVISLALAYLYFLRAPPVYQSESQILLIQKGTELPIEGLQSQVGEYRDSLSTHMLLVRSPLIVRRAVEEHRLGALASLAGHDDPTPIVMAGLTASRAGDRETSDTNVMDLTYRGADPQDCAKVLNAIVQTYQDFLGQTYQNFSDESVGLIGQAKDVLHKQLTGKEAAYRQFRQESPLLWKGEAGGNLHETRLGEIEAARSKLLVQQAQGKARMEAIQNALKRGGNREALTMLIGMSDSSKSMGRGSLEESLFPALLEEQMLLSQYGPDHPKVQALRKKVSLTREHLGGRPPSDEKPVDLLAVYIESLREELTIGEQSLSQYDELFETERQAAKSLSSYVVADETYRNEIARTQQLFNGVLKRLEEINLVKDYGGVKTQLLSPPSRGGQVEPQIHVILTIGGVLGLLAGLALGYLVDVADKSFRSPDEIRSQLGFPIVGHIPVIEPGKRHGKRARGEVLDPILCTFYQPRGRIAEAYRAVRTSLYFSARSGGHKVVQITSPEPGDGKTTLAANLAISMADSGKKVLLIEADFRRPRFHKLLGLQATSGLSSVIADNLDIADATQQTAVENLWAIPCGPRPHNPSELLTSPRFKELIDLVREQYDFVLVDTPPLLAITDPSVVAPRVDAVLLVIRLTKKTRSGAMRATEMLHSLGAHVLGVVVNGIGKSTGFGNGGYASGYGSQDGYDYGYGDKSYYDADEEHGKRAVAAGLDLKQA